MHRRKGWKCAVSRGGIDGADAVLRLPDLRYDLHLTDQNSVRSAFTVPHLNDADDNNTNNTGVHSLAETVCEKCLGIYWTRRCEAESVIDEHTIPAPNPFSVVLMMSML
jgi:hypothetical protein